MMSCQLHGAKSSSSATTGDGSGGGTFTASDIQKSWSSSCITSGVADPFSGATHFIFSLRLNSGSRFSFGQYWYGNSTCTGAASVMNYSLLGTYTVGGVVSGSMQSIQFTATDAVLTAIQEIAAGNTTVQGAINTACGGTSPFGGSTSSGDNGAWKDAHTMLCSGGPDFLATSQTNGSNSLINNVATYDGTYFTLGNGGSNAIGLPGVWSYNTTPSSVSIQLH